MPWAKDYIWQVPIGTQQMNSIVLDMFRAGVANRPGAKIQYYVMPHSPGNTPASWRRQFYGAAHGAKVINLFEFRPVQMAYTENHVSGPEMYQAVRTGIHELGRVRGDRAGRARASGGRAGLWFSEAADVWQDNHSPFGAGKPHALYRRATSAVAA